jgi:hypothetical protein
MLGPVTSAEMQTRIDAIDAILAAGTASVTMGDKAVTYDLDALRLERDRLLRLIASASASSFRRVVFKGGSAL